jgi:hypothetical protein
MYGITATVPPVRQRACCSHRTTKRVVIMEFAVVAFLVLIALASALGLVSDSRDSADWKPTAHGMRAARWD